MPECSYGEVLSLNMDGEQPGPQGHNLKHYTQSPRRSESPDAETPSLKYTPSLIIGLWEGGSLSVCPISGMVPPVFVMKGAVQK